MSALKPHPSYRPTDLPWLGQIPTHWDIKRLKFVAPASTNKLTNKPEDLPYVGLENIESGTGRLFMEIQPETVESNVAIFERGDILFGKLRPYLAKVAEPNFRGSCTTEILPLHPNKINSRYLFYSLLSSAFIEHVNSMTYGTKMPRANWEQIGNLAISIPPLEEQQIIVVYLDRQTAKIDALIAKKQRLLDLLAEQRAAIISQAVTKGLNPNVEMKDSGVAWLGQVPSHWEVLHLRRVINKFVDYRGHTPQKVGDGIPLITARNIKNGKIDWELSQEYIPEELYAEWMVRGFPEKGDVLVTMEAPLGETAQITETRIALAQRIILLKADKTKIKNDYLKYFLASSAGQGELWSRATGSTAIGIKASHLKEIIVLVPPIEEQAEITKVIQQEEKKIFALIPKVGAVIERLREYRATLISSAVTGKIDVRE